MHTQTFIPSVLLFCLGIFFITGVTQASVSTGEIERESEQTSVDTKKYITPIIKEPVGVVIDEDSATLCVSIKAVAEMKRNMYKKLREIRREKLVSLKIPLTKKEISLKEYLQNRKDFIASHREVRSDAKNFIFTLKRKGMKGSFSDILEEKGISFFLQNFEFLKNEQLDTTFFDAKIVHLKRCR